MFIHTHLGHLYHIVLGTMTKNSKLHETHMMMLYRQTTYTICHLKT